MGEQLIHGNTVKKRQNLGISLLLTCLHNGVSHVPISIEYKIVHGLNQTVFGT